MCDGREGMAFINVPLYTEIVRLAPEVERVYDREQVLGDIDVKRSYVQSSCLKTSSKKGSPATMPGLFPNNFASAVDSPTTNPP